MPQAWIDTNKTDAKDGLVGIVGYEIPFITSPINNLNYNIIWDGKNRCKKIITKRVV